MIKIYHHGIQQITSCTGLEEDVCTLWRYKSQILRPNHVCVSRKSESTIMASGNDNLRERASIAHVGSSVIYVYIDRDKSAYFYQCCPDTTMYFCWTSGFQDALNYLIIWAICFKPMS